MVDGSNAFAVRIADVVTIRQQNIQSTTWAIISFLVNCLRVQEKTNIQKT